MENEGKIFKSSVVGLFKTIRTVFILALITSATSVLLFEDLRRLHGHILMSLCLLEFLSILFLSFICEILTSREILSRQIESLGNTVREIQKKLDSRR